MQKYSGMGKPLQRTAAAASPAPVRQQRRMCCQLHILAYCVTMSCTAEFCVAGGGRSGLGRTGASVRATSRLVLE